MVGLARTRGVAAHAEQFFLSKVAFGQTQRSTTEQSLGKKNKVERGRQVLWVEVSRARILR